jgi:hypothetical protein
MKKLNRNRIQYQLLVTVLFLTQFVQAQPAFDDGDDVQDVPIDNWVLPMFILTLLLIYLMHRKHNLSRVK